MNRNIRLLKQTVSLPEYMPGEDVPAQSTFGAAYDWHGQPIDSDPLSGGMLMANWNARKDHQFLTELTFEEKQFEVTTTWLGMNHNHSGGVPLVWETMATGDGDWVDFQVRYATQAAAKYGHIRIVSVLTRAGMQVKKSTIYPGIEP